MPIFIEPEIQYLASSYAIIAESASTTKKDLIDGFVEFLDSYEETDPQVIHYPTRLVPRIYDPYEDHKAIANNNLKPLKEVFESIDNHNKSYTFFKLLYIRYLYIPINHDGFTKIRYAYKSACSDIQRRTYLKAYYYINSYFDRFAQSLYTIKYYIAVIYEVINDGNIKIVQFLLDVSNMNRLIIAAIDLARNYACQFGNFIVGSTTSNDPLIVYYQLLGQLNGLRTKHIRIAKCFNAYMSNYVMRRYIRARDIIDKFQSSLNTAKILLLNNLEGFHYLLNAVVNYNDTNMDYVVKLVTNSKSSTVTPFAFNFHDFIKEYHIKTLMCFNTDKIFSFIPGDHIGTSEYLPPLYTKCIDKTLESKDLKINSDFFLELKTTAVMITCYSFYMKFKSIMEHLEKLAETNKLVRDAEVGVKAILGKCQNFSNNDDKAAMIQRFMTLHYNKSIKLFKLLQTLEEKILKINNYETKIYFQFVSKVGYKFVFKNVYDLVYFAIMRYGRFIYFLELIEKNKALFTGNSTKVLSYHIFRYLSMIRSDIKLLKVFLGSVRSPNTNFYNNRKIIEFFEIVDSITKTNDISSLIDALKKIRLVMLSFENVVTKTGMRLTFRLDRTFEKVELKNKV